jgi:hypothetical protein
MRLGPFVRAKKPVRDRMARMEKLIQLLVRGVTPEPNAGQRMRMLAARYNKAIANHSPRETWMEQVEFLIAPARVV